MEHCVLENNTMNIYENFFDDLVPTRMAKEYNLRYTYHIQRINSLTL